MVGPFEPGVRENYALVENSAESARTVLLAAAIVGLIAFG